MGWGDSHLGPLTSQLCTGLGPETKTPPSGSGLPGGPPLPHWRCHCLPRSRPSGPSPSPVRTQHSLGIETGLFSAGDLRHSWGPQREFRVLKTSEGKEQGAADMSCLRETLGHRARPLPSPPSHQSAGRVGTQTGSVALGGKEGGTGVEPVSGGPPWGEGPSCSPKRERGTALQRLRFQPLGAQFRFEGRGRGAAPAQAPEDPGGDGRARGGTWLRQVGWISSAMVTLPCCSRRFTSLEQQMLTELSTCQLLYSTKERLSMTSGPPGPPRSRLASFLASITFRGRRSPAMAWQWAVGRGEPGSEQGPLPLPGCGLGLRVPGHGARPVRTGRL